MNKTTARLTHIDSMRGIAALLVVLNHLFPYLSNNVNSLPSWYGFIEDINITLDFGRIGVDLFFIISGYVIPFSLTMGTRSVAGFAINRIMRIYPLVWVAFAATALFQHQQPIDLDVVVLNLLLLAGFVGKPEMGLLWTLRVEMIFYITCAALFSLGFLQKPKLPVLVVILAISWNFAAALPLPGLPRLPIGWTTFIFLMFIGSMLRYADSGVVGRRLAYSLVAGFLASRLCVSFAIIGYDSTEMMRMIHDYCPILIAIVYFLLMNNLMPITFHPLVFIGKISYSIYLLHPLLYFATIKALGALNIHAPILLVLILIFSVIIAVSSLTYFTIELPAIRLGHRWAAKIGRQPIPAQKGGIA